MPPTDAAPRVAEPATPPLDIEPLLRPMLPQAYGVALRLTGNAQDAEDLLQEACLLAIRGLHGFEAHTSFRAWFYRILHNRFCSRWRHDRRRGTTVTLDDASEVTLRHSASEPEPEPRADPATAACDRVDGERAVAALRALPDDFREVALLYFLDDLSYADIAGALGIPVGTVRSRLHRARHLLQASLRGLARDHGVGHPPDGGHER